MKLDIRAEFKEVQRYLDGIREDVGNKVVARTLNRLADKTKTAAVRQIAATYAIRQAKVRERIAIRKAFAKGSLTVTVYVTGTKRAINLVAFATAASRKRAENGNRTKRGKLKAVSVKVLRGAPPKVMKGPVFIGNKGRTLFRRTGEKRLPIEPVRTIDVPQMFNARKVHDQLLAVVRTELPAEFERQLAFVLRSAR